MLISGAFIFIFSLICEGHSKVYHHYKRIACGETITQNEGFYLPVGKSCEIYIDPPVGLDTTVDMWWARSSVTNEEMCSSVQIVDDDTEEEYSPCEAAASKSYFFTGKGRSYTIKVDNLPDLATVHVEFLSKKYKCGDQLKYDMFGIPVEFMTNGSSTDDCSLIVPANAFIYVDHTDTSSKLTECIDFHITQGPSLRRATLTTEHHCVGERRQNAPIRFSVICSAAQFHMTALTPGTSVKITMMPVNQEHSRQFIEMFAEHCVSYSFAPKPLVIYDE